MMKIEKLFMNKSSKIMESIKSKQDGRGWEWTVLEMDSQEGQNWWR